MRSIVTKRAIGWVYPIVFAVFLAVIPGAGSTELAPMDLTVAKVIDDLDLISKKLIVKAGKRSGALVMASAGQARLVVDELKTIYGTEKEKSFVELNLEEKTVFENIHKTFTYLLRDLGGSEKKLHKLSRDLSTATEPFFVDTKIPRVLSYKPNYVISIPNKDLVQVSIHGVHLSRYAPHIDVDDTKIEPSVSTSGKLVFSIPSSVFQPDPGFKVTYREVILTLYEVRRNWFTFGLKNKHIPVRYSIVFYVMPRHLAKYSVTTRNTISRIERRSGHGPVWSTLSSSLNGGGNKDIRMTFRHVAEDGWTFDPDSARFTVTTPGDKDLSRVNIITSPNLITLEINGQGRGDSGNNFKGYISYTEWRHVKTMEEKVVVDDTLDWSDAKVHILPDQTDSYHLSLELFNGSKRSYSGLSDQDSFANIHYDPASRELRIMPRSPSKVLGG